MNMVGDERDGTTNGRGTRFRERWIGVDHLIFPTAAILDVADTKLLSIVVAPTLYEATLLHPQFFTNYSTPREYSLEPSKLSQKPRAFPDAPRNPDGSAGVTQLVELIQDAPCPQNPNARHPASGHPGSGVATTCASHNTNESIFCDAPQSQRRI